jgi:predicted metal-dependent phosphoesterase TrpH
VNAARRYPITMALIVLVLLSALDPLPSLIDAVTGSAATDADLVRPLGYIVVAPLSDVLDALTFLSLERAGALLAVWAAALALWGALRPGTFARRITRAVVAPLTLLALAVATLLLPRPVPRVVALDSAVTVMDYHAHTEASHDGRPGWTTRDLARWHAAQGFGASYVTDHNRVFEGRVEGPTNLLPGAEWSVYRQHILALGELTPIERGLYNRDTPSLLGIFSELHRRGALAIGSIPEYWRNHWDDLDDFVKAGIDGFEIVNCAPKAIGFPDQARAWVVSLARRHNLLLIGGSDNHGWGKATCVWNLASPSAHGYEANHVLARPLALLQGQWKPWTAAYTQPWFMLRSLTWPERASWLTWMLIFLIYRAVPRREGDPGGIGILARSLSLKILKLRRPTTTT